MAIAGLPKPGLGRLRPVNSRLGRAAAASYRDAVDDERVSEEIEKVASGIGAVDCAVIVHDQRAVAVVDIPATARTTAHAVVDTSYNRQDAVFATGVSRTRGRD